MPTSKDKKVRLDSLVVEKGLADSLAAAKRLIMAGMVIVGDQMIDKPGKTIDKNLPLRLKADGRSGFVGRGGEKLMGAVEFFELKPVIWDKVVLDVGASTGGFTDCCLRLGARTVISLDVGSAQLDWRLRQHPKVISLEKTDIRDFKPEDYPPLDLIVGDISFNSLCRLGPAFLKAAPKQGTLLLLLVKPQFELPRALIPTGGVIVDEKLISLATEKVIQSFSSLGYEVLGTFPSKVKGRAGNQEIFLLCQLAIPSPLLPI